jgi:hypothetical protein
MRGSATMAMPQHRRGAMTMQITLRRRNPKGGRQLAVVRSNPSKIDA